MGTQTGRLDSSKPNFNTWPRTRDMQRFHFVEAFMHLAFAARELSARWAIEDFNADEDYNIDFGRLFPMSVDEWALELNNALEKLKEQR